MDNNNDCLILLAKTSISPGQISHIYLLIFPPEKSVFRILIKQNKRCIIHTLNRTLREGDGDGPEDNEGVGTTGSYQFEAIQNARHPSKLLFLDYCQ